MYLGNLSGSGPGEWKGVPKDTGWQQSVVDARWAAIGQPAPAPLVPATLIGWKPWATRGPRMVQITPATKNLAEILKLKKVNSKNIRGLTKEENDFYNFWGKVAVDPYRKQGLVSKVAGGILQVASVVFPVMGYAQAVKGAADYASAKGAAKSDQKLAERVLAPAYAAQEAKESAAAKADFDAQLKKLQALAPQVAAPLSLAPVGPVASNALPVDLTNKPASPKGAGFTNAEITVAVILGGALLLGAARR